MESKIVCQKCTQKVNTNDDRYIICKGACAGRFHCSCMGIRGMHWKVINELTRNLLWMCDCCMEDFTRSTNSSSPESTAAVQANAIEADVSELKIAVAGIIDTIASMTKTEPSISPVNNIESVPSSPPDRNILLNGTAYVDTTADGGSEHIEDGDYFSLLLTNIDSIATERDVQWMVSRAIGLTTPERFNVTKLVSKWKTNFNLDFVSFKVVLPSEFKLRALDPATWPKNVRFREFVRINNTWKPSMRFTP